MNKLITLLGVLMFSFNGFNQSVSSALIESANSSFDSANYEEALAMYQEVLDQGEANWQTHYNAGLCYAHLKNWSKSLLALERAKKVGGNHKSIAKAISFCESHLPKQQLTRTGFMDKLGIMVPWSSSFWGWMSVFFAAAALLAFVFSKRLSKHLFVKVSNIKMLVFSCLFLISMVLGYLKWKTLDQSLFAVTLKSAVIKQEPKQESETVGSLFRGAKVYVLETGDEWRKVRFGSSEGWVLNGSLEAI